MTRVCSPPSQRGRRMISLTHSSLWIFGVSFHIPGSPIPSLKILDIIPKKQTYKRALQRIYLERGSVHACIQLCTHVYTLVYTRVYSPLLSRRCTLGMPGASTQLVLCLLYALLYSHTIVFSWVGLALPLRSLLVAFLCALGIRGRRAVLHDSYPDHAVASP